MEASLGTGRSSGLRRLRAPLLASLLAFALLTACGDDGASAQERYCNAGESLRTSLAALTSLDLVASGTDGLESAIDEVKDDLSELRDAASEASTDEVEAFNQAVEALDSAFSDLGGELTVDNATAVGTAIQDVSAAAQAVFTTLSDC